MNLKTEHIIIALLVIAIGAVAFMRLKPSVATAPTMANPQGDVAQSVTDENANVSQGADYLIANQGPWAFAPDVNAFQPKLAAPGGTPVQVSPPPSYGCVDC